MSKKPVKKKTPAKKKAAPKKVIGEAVAKKVGGMTIGPNGDGTYITLTPPEELTRYVGESPDQWEARKKHFRESGGLYSLLPDDKYTHLERMFILYYTTNNGNGTQATKDAGYQAVTDNTFASIAYENLRKPHIKSAIEKIMSEKVMGREEALNRLSTMARASLNDYLHVVKKSVRPMVKVSLNVLIAETRAKIDDQNKYITRLEDLKAKDTELVALRDEIAWWQRQIIKYEIALERDPMAYEERPGPEQLEEVIELDLIKLAQDKERGLIKSMKQKDGVWEIELYGADSALTNIGRYHGIFDKDNKRTHLVSEPLTREEIKQINDELESHF